MKIGIIGLGRMGCAIAHRLLDADVEVFGFDTNQQACISFQEHGGRVVQSVADLARATTHIWLMVPAGKLIDEVLQTLIPVLTPDSIIIDGGNSFFKDSKARAERLRAHKINFLDCGTSGGLHGEQEGFSLMVGGERVAYERMEPYLRIIAAPQGYAYVGPSGAGHYVKMVHNGIEYALLQAYAEGLNLLHEGFYKDLDLAAITDVWQHGSIICSHILQLVHNVLSRDQKLDDITGVTGGGQTGTWAVETAHEQKVSVPLLEEALRIRAWSQETGGNYATKLVALLRHEFGGHELKKK